MKIAIVGAGNGGTKLLKFFVSDDSSNVVQMIDKNLNSPGILLAKEYGISISNNIMEIKDEVEVIIEATGNSDVLNKICQLYADTKNIIDSNLAAIMMRVIEKQIKITKKVSSQLEIIQETASKLENEMQNLLSLSDSLNSISDRLTTSSNEYKKYITETDKSIRSLNKITQQVKILGLNANIEAARAGEHGKGFAVVATGVQRLSDTTASFASYISELLESMTNENENIANEIKNLGKITMKQLETSNALTEVAKSLKKELQS